MTEYEMTEEDYQKLVKACQPTPAMWGSGGAKLFPTPADNARAFWRELGQRMGFDWETAQPAPGKSDRFFLAVSREPKT